MGSWCARFVGVLFAASLAVHVHAAPFVLRLVPGGLFVIDYTILAQPNTAYNLKLRLSQSETQCQPRCSGETWYGSAWLDQSDAWAKFPHQQADATGKLHGILIGRAPLDSQATFLQLAIRPAEGTTVHVAQTWSVTWLVSEVSAEVSVHLPSGAPAQSYLRVTDAFGQQNIPLVTSPIHFSAGSEAVHLALMAPDGVVLAQQSYTLVGKGYHHLEFPAGVVELVSPRLEIDSPAPLFRGSEVIVCTHTAKEYKGDRQWYIDGVKQAEQGVCLRLASLSVGSHDIRVHLLQTQEQAAVTVLIQPYNAVKLVRLVPNRASGEETIIVHNGHTVPADLVGWHLQSRASRTSIPLSGTVAPQSERTIQTKNRLANTGGSYDLYDDRGVLVDTVTYAAVEPEDEVVRDGLVWQSPHQTEIGHTPPLSAEHVHIQGSIVLPRGKTFDLKTSQGDMVHVVIHSSFDGAKPRFQRGDKVVVSGVWKFSKTGRYLSVRRGDSLVLVQRVRSQKAKTPARVARRVVAVLAPPVVAAAAGAGDDSAKGPPHDLPPPEAQTLDVPKWLGIIFAVMITAGIVITFGSTKKA